MKYKQQIWNWNQIKTQDKIHVFCVIRLRFTPSCQRNLRPGDSTVMSISPVSCSSCLQSLILPLIRTSTQKQNKWSEFSLNFPRFIWLIQHHPPPLSSSIHTHTLSSPSKVKASHQTHWAMLCCCDYPVTFRPLTAPHACDQVFSIYDSTGNRIYKM